jgi:putative transposase
MAGKDAAAYSGGDCAGGEHGPVRIARELIDKARAEGMSLVGPNGLLRQVTKRVSVPRDREGTFDPVIVPTYARRIEGLHDMVISLCVRKG